MRYVKQVLFGLVEATSTACKRAIAEAILWASRSNRRMRASLSMPCRESLSWSKPGKETDTLPWVVLGGRSRHSTLGRVGAAMWTRNWGSRRGRRGRSKWSAVCRGAEQLKSAVVGCEKTR